MHHVDWETSNVVLTKIGVGEKGGPGQTTEMGIRDGHRVVNAAKGVILNLVCAYRTLIGIQLLVIHETRMEVMAGRAGVGPGIAAGMHQRRV